MPQGQGLVGKFRLPIFQRSTSIPEEFYQRLAGWRQKEGLIHDSNHVLIQQLGFWIVDESLVPDNPSCINVVRRMCTHAV